MSIWRLIVALILLPLQALAADRQFANGEPVTLAPDQGYVLVRTFQVAGGGLHGTSLFAPVLIRVLSDAEIAQAKALAAGDPDHWQEHVDSNVVEPLADKPYAVVNHEEYLLTSLRPGTYILGGLAVTNWAFVSAGIMATSLAMGTVKFEVKPGVITDLGAILGAFDDRPTDIPELANVVTGKPIGYQVLPTTMALKLDPADVPADLGALPRVSADYRAVSPMPNYIGAPLSRLAPLAGVLDYDKDGNVIDLKAGTAP